MKRTLLALGVLVLGSVSMAQVHPGELLVSSLLGGDPGLSQYRQDGTLVETYANGLGWAADILPTGFWATASRDLQRLFIYDPVTDLEVTNVFLMDVARPHDIESFSDGTLVISDTSSPFLYHYDQAGNTLHKWSSFSPVTWSHIDSNNEIWASLLDQAVILHLDSNGIYVDHIIAPELTSDMVSSPDDTLWVLAGWNTSSTGSGKVYRYSKTGVQLGFFTTPARNLATTDQDGVVSTFCDESQNPNNTSDISINGVELVAGRTVHLTNGPSNQFCYLLIGSATGVVSQPPGSKGDLCVTGGNCLGRYVKDIGKIDGSGSFSTDISNSLSGGPNFGIPTCGGNIEAGETWAFQYWHRQSGGQPSSFSSAIWVTFK